MNGARIASLLSVLALAAAVELPAQDQSPLAPGYRAQVTAEDSVGSMTATATVVAEDAVWLYPDVDRWHGSFALPIVSVKRIEVSRGKRSASPAGTRISRDDPVGRTRRRLSLVVELGRSLGGPGAGLAEQLRQAGFGDTSPRLCLGDHCSGPTSYPTQEAPGGPVGLTARFAISGAVAVGAGYGNTSLGGSMGYRANAEPPGWFSGDHLISHWDATMAWVGAFWKPHPAVRLGGGPGWYQLENHDARSVKVSQVGLMVEVGAEVPAARRFFLDLAIRLHLIPAKNVEHGWTEPITLRPNWTHAALLAGLGLHL